MSDNNDTVPETPDGASGATQEQAGTTTRVEMSEAELQAIHIGGMAPLTGLIQIDDYNPEWPALFEREAARIRAALGDRVVLLEHVGST